MKYYFLFFFLFKVYLFSSIAWNAESLIQHLKNVIKEGLQDPQFLLIDSNNVIKNQDLGLINSKQNELFKKYNISTYIFLLSSIREGRKKFILNLLKQLPAIHNKINIDNSIILLINMRKKKSLFNYGKKITRLFSKQQKKNIRKELYKYLKIKMYSEGIVNTLEKILEELKTKSYKNLIIAIIILVLFTLFKIFRKKNLNPNLIHKKSKTN